MPSAEPTRRVLLLETDERAGLVAALALACASCGVSLDITSGPGHVLLTFTASEDTVTALRGKLADVHGVSQVHAYAVVPPRGAYVPAGSGF